jgi:ABC-type transport system involved in cytochrome c biogenesis permease subunit
MDNMWELYFYYGALLAYSMSLVLYLTFAALRRPGLVGQGELAFTVGYIFHTLALAARWYGTGMFPLGTQFELALCLAWTIALGLLIMAGKYRYKALGVFIMPLILGLYLYSTTLYTAAMATASLTANSWPTLNLGLAVAGYGAFGTAFGLACPRILDGRWGFGMSQPVREATDSLLTKVLILGFGLMTIAIIGTIWFRINARIWTPTQTWSLITWLVYATTVYTRPTNNAKGKAIAWLTVFGFLCVMVTVLGGNLLK